jgi:hypothetical protein
MPAICNYYIIFWRDRIEFLSSIVTTFVLQIPILDFKVSYIFITERLFGVRYNESDNAGFRTQFIKFNHHECNCTNSSSRFD